MPLPGGTFAFLFTVTDSSSVVVTGLATVRVIPAGIPLFAGLALTTPTFNTMGGANFTVQGVNFRTFDTAYATYGSYSAVRCVCVCLCVCVRERE